MAFSTLFPAKFAVPVFASAWICAIAVTPARAEPLEPWIGAGFAYIAPTTAQMAGANFLPGEPLWLEVTDPLGAVTTMAIFADDGGRILVDIAVVEPGVHWGRIRDGAGQLLSEAELLVGTD